MVRATILASLFTAAAYAARIAEREADVHASDLIPHKHIAARQTVQEPIVEPLRATGPHRTQPLRGSQQPPVMSLKDDLVNVGKAAAAGALAIGVAMATPAQALTKDDINQLTYLQIKGTGLANRCADVIGEGSIKPGSGQKLVDMCIEPKAWFVEDEGVQAEKTKSEFVKGKVMTRQTYSLDDVQGNLEQKGGSIVFTEKDGIDYAATTVQLPGGERVPFLFTVKNLVAKGNGDTFKPGFTLGGDYAVPSYRSGLFLDPKGRGVTTGYDMAVALPGLQSGEEGDKELFKENNKKFDVGTGRIEMEVKRVNEENKEIAGLFVASQPGDTDLGSKVPKKILTKGVFYARVE